ncbi:hypothetical protein LR48_Vigan62s000700 [Vigna angularis]|uniref:Uncharacterized protein n=1 Tax=Phaseolus angularis TaxID=3914 RepID=A0A0L9T3P4_PHAAN|nr:hypothetical protein LR48_Vigan62s000700 [Vigna angularis]
MVKGVPIILDDDIWTNVAQLTIYDYAVRFTLVFLTSIVLSLSNLFYEIPNKKPTTVNYWWVDSRARSSSRIWILNHVHIDCPALIADTRLKAKKYHAYHLPYALLISRILEYKGVSVDGEHTQVIQSIGTEIGETTFWQMGFLASGKPVRAATPSKVGPSAMPSSSTLSMEEHFVNLSKQTQFDHIIEMQQTHQEYVYERLEDFDTHLGNIQEHLNLQPP